MISEHVCDRELCTFVIITYVLAMVTTLRKLESHVHQNSHYVNLFACMSSDTICPSLWH